VILSNWTSLFRSSVDEMIPGEVFPVLKVQFLNVYGLESTPTYVLFSFVFYFFVFIFCCFAAFNRVATASLSMEEQSTQ
jgi:hypothetical protein